MLLLISSLYLPPRLSLLNQLHNPYILAKDLPSFLRYAAYQKDRLTQKLFWLCFFPNPNFLLSLFWTVLFSPYWNMEVCPTLYFGKKKKVLKA